MAKRILIYTNHFFPENFKVNDVADLLAQENFEVKVITGIPNYPAGKIYKGYGFFNKTKETLGKIKIRRLPLIPRGKGSSVLLLLNYFSYFFSCLTYTLWISVFGKKYDAIFVHHTSPIFIAIPPIFYRFVRRNTKLILWDLDIWPDTLVALGVIKNKTVIDSIEKLSKWIYVKYDKIFVGSQSFLIKAKERVNLEKVEYFPNWAENVFVEDIKIAPDQPQEFPSGFNIMYAGNIGECQDFQTVFESIKILKDEDVNWLLVGDGRSREWLENEVRKEGIENKVHFYGNHKLQSMPYFFSQADVMFFSLKNDEIFYKTVPAKLQAYMASGKPVIGMISGEGAKIIEDSNSGLSVPSGNFKLLAQKIIELSKYNERELQRLGSNAKKYYAHNFSVQGRRNQLLRALK